MGGNVSGWVQPRQQQNIQPLPQHLQMQEVLRRQGLPPAVDNQAEMLGLVPGAEQAPVDDSLSTGTLVGGAAGGAASVGLIMKELSKELDENESFLKERIGYHENIEKRIKGAMDAGEKAIPMDTPTGHYLDATEKYLDRVSLDKKHAKIDLDKLLKKKVFARRLFKSSAMGAPLHLAGSLMGGVAGKIVGGVINAAMEAFDAEDVGAGSDIVPGSPTSEKHTKPKSIADLREMNERASTQSGRMY